MRRRLITGIVLIVALLAVPLTSMAQPPTYQEFGTPEFEKVWERTDYPVEQLIVARTWLWGPGANTGLLEEEYEEAEDGIRIVQYTDKSRMEMPWTTGSDPDSPWFITQGLLATELMTGDLQLGDATFESHSPADIPVAGDADDVSGPTYAIMGGLMDEEPREADENIIEAVTADGEIYENPDLADYGVTDDYWIQETGHYIASVFWEFMNSTGTIYVDGELHEDEPLFESPFYAVGFPKTPAYWAWVKVDGEQQHVLVQCFERRCLTYAPNNPDGWEIESGNMGQHYYHWRYNLIGEPPEITLTLAQEHDVNPVGTSHELTATLTSDDQPVDIGDASNVEVAIDRDGVDVDPIEDLDVTVAGNVSTISYTGPNVPATDTIQVTVTYEGGEASNSISKTWVVESSPPVFTSLDLGELDGSSQGDSTALSFAVENPDESEGGQSYAHVAFALTIDVPGSCADDAWTDWFQFTGWAAAANVNISCSNGEFSGQIGAGLGLSMDPGDSFGLPLPIPISVTGAVTGDYEVTVELIDKSDDSVLASITSDFSIVD